MRDRHTGTRLVKGRDSTKENTFYPYQYQDYVSQGTPEIFEFWRLPVSRQNPDVFPETILRSVHDDNL